jgi:ABC-type transport system involved in cytochrome bd biosynthesis fused ATPase/permease subunit
MCVCLCVCVCVCVCVCLCLADLAPYSLYFHSLYLYPFPTFLSPFIHSFNALTLTLTLLISSLLVSFSFPPYSLERLAELHGGSSHLLAKLHDLLDRPSDFMFGKRSKCFNGSV